MGEAPPAGGTVVGSRNDLAEFVVIRGSVDDKACRGLAANGDLEWSRSPPQLVIDKGHKGRSSWNLRHLFSRLLRVCFEFEGSAAS